MLGSLSSTSSSCFGRGPPRGGSRRQTRALAVNRRRAPLHVALIASPGGKEEPGAPFSAERNEGGAASTSVSDPIPFQPCVSSVVFNVCE
jgi:hypothetical protein